MHLAPIMHVKALHPLPCSCCCLKRKLQRKCSCLLRRGRRRVIREAGAVPALLLLIQRGVDATVEAATRALTNLLCDSEPAAAAAAATGAVTLLVLMLGCGRDALCQVCLPSVS